MIQHLPSEIKEFSKSLTKVDLQTALILILAGFLGLWKFTFGSADFFDQELASFFSANEKSIWSYLYFFVTQFITGFGIPIFVLLVLFRRRPSEVGLGLGNVKLGLIVFALYIPLVTLGAWILSAQISFQDKYPLLKAVVYDWKLFVFYELLFLFYWIGWEYLWRGFLLFGTARTFGPWSILIQMLPFAALHAQKPMPEAYLSIPGALVMGLLVWRCRSFWIAVPIHAYQMMIMDFFCILRLHE